MSDSLDFDIEESLEQAILRIAQKNNFGIITFKDKLWFHGAENILPDLSRITRDIVTEVLDHVKEACLNPNSELVDDSPTMMGLDYFNSLYYKTIEAKICKIYGIKIKE